MSEFNRLQDAVQRRGAQLTDGALGTEYQRQGLPVGSCADLLNLDHPETVFQVTRAYAKAGSDVVLTTTFRANSLALESCGRARDAVAINLAAAQIARAAAGEAIILGNVGPSGTMPHQISDVRLRAAFTEQCEALAQGGVDGLVLETFSDIAEARIALSAAQATGLPTIVSFTFQNGPEHDRTLTGITPEQAALAMEDAGAYGVGANCGTGFDAHVGICRRMHAATSLPLWIKPNAGLPLIGNGHMEYASTPEEFASYVPRYIENGATFIGGCCGTTPEFIRAAAAAMELQ